VVRDTGIEPV